MEQREIAIKCRGVKKKYKLGAIGGGTLREELQSRLARLLGREDPNLPIGTDARLIGKTFWALDGIDLTVYRGERLGIIGNNGAGKSTLLKLLSQITAPTDGDIDIWGRISSLLEIGTGFNGEMTGRENIYLNGAILGMSKAEIDRKIDKIIEFSEIAEFIDTPVKRYSSGMFVKLAFAVAAHLDSEILVMDEVLAVGDMAFQQKCLDKMRQAADIEGKTVLYVSHNMDTIRRLCDRCIVLYQGKIIYDGDVEGAIAVYLNHSLDDNPVDMDLRGRAIEPSDYLAFEHLTLPDKSLPIYNDDEPLLLDFKIKALKPIEKIRLRLTLRSETDVGIGTSWSKPFDFPTVGEYKIKLRMPLDVIAKGKLYASIGLYYKDEIGNDIPLEHITRAFRIELPGLPIWNTTAHGFVNLPITSVTEISKI